MITCIKQSDPHRGRRLGRLHTATHSWYIIFSIRLLIERTWCHIKLSLWLRSTSSSKSEDIVAEEDNALVGCKSTSPVSLIRCEVCKVYIGSYCVFSLTKSKRFDSLLFKVKKSLWGKGLPSISHLWESLVHISLKSARMGRPSRDRKDHSAFWVYDMLKMRRLSYR